MDRSGTLRRQHHGGHVYDFTKVMWGSRLMIPCSNETGGFDRLLAAFRIASSSFAQAFAAKAWRRMLEFKM